MSAPDWPLGHIVGRRYTVQQVLGRTPFTRTYAALTEPNKEVVLRVYGAESNEAIDEMMESLPDYTNFPEAGILRVLEIGSDPATGARFVVTERSRHPSLASMVELCPLAIHEATAFAQRLANAIDVAHDRKLLHLGLKPSNVFVGTMPNGGVDVSDFGAPRVGPISFEQARWQAPEQIAEHQPAASADVFSFALVVFFAMTGKSYWRATGVEELASELSAARVAASTRATELGVTLPKEMDAAFAAALASDPSKRPTRAADFAGALAGKPLVIPTRTSIPPRPTAKTPSVSPPRPVVPPAIDDIPPPPQELLARVAPVLAPQPVMMIGDAPPVRPETAPSPPAPPTPPPENAPPPAPMAWKDEAPTDPVQTPLFEPPPLDAPAPAAFSAPPPVVNTPRTSSARQRRVTTIALSALAGMLFLLAGIIMIVALQKKPKHDTAQTASATVVKSAAPPVASPAVADVPPIATSVAAVPAAAPSDAPSAAPSATTDPAPTAPTTDDSTPTLTLGPHDSELLVVCEPQPCSLVMIDRKKMKEYPGPTIVPPGAHGVGIDADGCWGGWKLVTTKAGERTTVTFTLNKRPPGVANPLGKKKQPLPF